MFTFTVIMAPPWKARNGFSIVSSGVLSCSHSPNSLTEGLLKQFCFGIQCRILPCFVGPWIARSISEHQQRGRPRIQRWFYCGLPSLYFVFFYQGDWTVEYSWGLLHDVLWWSINCSPKILASLTCLIREFGTKEAASKLKVVPFGNLWYRSLFLPP